MEFFLKHASYAKGTKLMLQRPLPYTGVVEVSGIAPFSGSRGQRSPIPWRDIVTVLDVRGRNQLQPLR